MDLIERQAAIDALNEYFARIGKFQRGGQREKAINLDVVGVIKTLPPVQPGISQWIPVTDDTLPDEGKVVVALGKKGTWDFGTYRGHGGNIHYWVWKKNTYKKVYWWMYKDNALPKPYREGGKENDPD